MPVTGQQLINGSWQPGGAGGFFAVNPRNGETVAPQISQAGKAQVLEAVAAAQQAFQVFRHTSLSDRAKFLRQCADEIMALGDVLLETMQAETGYPEARCIGERGRTTGQLKMFADYIESGEYLDPRIDPALPDRKPLPRVDIRSVNQALGVVAVFSVSNFPLAFSTAGGDTASALAAGCPVIVKGHPSHPGTGELVAQALAKAVKTCGLPAGVFSFVQCDNEAARALIEAGPVKAIAFTGSQRGGLAISKIAAGRPEPIPVFAEMGSINPFLLLPEKLASDAEAIAKGFVGSLTMGTGQFCVNPGLVLAIEGEGLDRFTRGVAEALADHPAGVMLNAGIGAGYQKGVDALAGNGRLERVGNGKNDAPAGGSYAQAFFFRMKASDFLASPELREEVFGPASILVVCKDAAELLAVATSVQGQLTATVHATEQEMPQYRELFAELAETAGRLVINGYPTGVEVCHAMVHGGPFPASTDSRFTSVGSNAIKRFVRPVCYQNCPQTMLPDALKDANPLGLSRFVDGAWTRDALG